MSSVAKATTTLDITLLGREYRVSCAPDERDSLLRAVEFLSTKMSELSAKTKSTGERLAVMTALNLAHELLVMKESGPAAEATQSAGGEAPDPAFDSQDFARRIDSIAARLDAAMAEQEKLF